MANIGKELVIASASEAIQGGLCMRLDCFVAFALRVDEGCAFRG